MEYPKRSSRRFLRKSPHLVVNPGYMSWESAKRLIVDAAHSPDYQMTSVSRQAFDDFALSSRVHATPALANDLTHGQIDIDAHEGAISISGTIPDGISEQHLIDTIKTIAGVKNVKADLVNFGPSLGLAE